MAASEGRAGALLAGRYRLVSRVGLGAAPEGWRGGDRDGSPLLVFVYPDVALDDATLARVRADVAAALAVEHPRVVPLRDVGCEPGVGAWGVCPWPEGRPVAARVEAEGPLPYADATTVVCDALHGLAALHERGAVHRGVTSAEVLVLADAQGALRGKLLTAGMLGAAVRDAARGRGVWGSPHHLAPELCRGEKARPESDVWAMGVVLHEALVGALPFDGESPLEVVASVLHDEPAALDPRVPPALAAVVREALAKDADARPPDAEAMCLSLSAALSSVRASQVTPMSLRPATPRLEVAGIARGQATELGFDDLDALVATVKSEAPPPTSVDPSLDPPPQAAADFDLDFGAPVPSPLPEPAALQVASAPPAPALSLPPAPAPVVPPALQSLPSPLLVPAKPAVSFPPTPSLTSLPPVAQRDSVTHTSLTPDVIDRTSVPVRRRPAGPNPYVAFLGVAVVTGGLVFAGWQITHDDAPHAPHAPPPRARRAPTKVRGANHRARDAGPTARPAADPAPDEPDAPRAPLPEETAPPVELGAQVTVPIPADLPTDAALQFVRHVVVAAPPDARTARGFASCAAGRVFLHAGGLDPTLRATEASLRCDAADLALVPDVDGDGVSDVAGVDLRGDGLLVVGSRGMRVARRIALPGALALVGGLQRADRRRTEPMAVAFAAPPEGGASLVAVGLRTGRVAWRTLPGFVPATPKDYGLAVGGDLDGDGVADLVVGLLRDGHRCVAALSGATGSLVWPAPRCFENASAQALSLGPDISGDGRAEVAIANAVENRVRILSGEDGAELRAVAPDNPVEALAFGAAMTLSPSLTQEGAPLVVASRTQPDGAALELYSASDGRRVGRRALESVEPGAAALVRLHFVEGFAFEGSRSLLAATTRGVTAFGAAVRADGH